MHGFDVVRTGQQALNQTLAYQEVFDLIGEHLAQGTAQWSIGHRGHQVKMTAIGGH